MVASRDAFALVNIDTDSDGFICDLQCLAVALQKPPRESLEPRVRQWTRRDSIIHSSASVNRVGSAIKWRDKNNLWYLRGNFQLRDYFHSKLRNHEITPRWALIVTATRTSHPSDPPHKPVSVAKVIEEQLKCCDNLNDRSADQT